MIRENDWIDSSSYLYQILKRMSDECASLEAKRKRIMSFHDGISYHIMSGEIETIDEVNALISFCYHSEDSFSKVYQKIKGVKK